MNFGAARTRVRQTLSLTSTDDSMVGDLMNEAILDVAREGMPVRAWVSFETVEGQTQYDLFRDLGAMELTQVRIVATGGTYTLTVGGQTTAAIAYNATAAVIKTRLEALSTVDDGEIEVVKGEGLGGLDDPIIVELRWLERLNMAVTSTPTLLTGPDADAQVTTRLEGGQQGVLLFEPDDDVLTDSGFSVDVQGVSTIVLDPVPQASGTVISGWIVPRPVVLVVTTDDAVELPFPREAQRAVIYRTLQLAAEWDNQDPGMSANFESKYETDVRKMRRQRNHALGGGARRGLRPSAVASPLVWGDQFPWGSM